MRGQTGDGWQGAYISERIQRQNPSVNQSLPSEFTARDPVAPGLRRCQRMQGKTDVYLAA